MTIALLVFVALSCAVTYPAYSASRRRGAESPLLLVIAVPAVVVWGLVTALGYGAQSLTAIVEVMALFGLGVVLAYVKVYVVDTAGGNRRVTTYSLAALLVVVAAILRAMMPDFPE